LCFRMSFFDYVFVFLFTDGRSLLCIHTTLSTSAALWSRQLVVVLYDAALVNP